MGKVAPAVAILLAACGSDTSVAIEVSTSDSSITSVELFVADTQCTTCAGIAPPGVTSTEPRPLGRVDYTITNDRFTSSVSKGIAGFRLEPSATATTITKLAAVGYTANGAAVAFVLDDASFSLDAAKGTIRRYELTTRPIDSVQPPSAMPGLAPQPPKKGGDDVPSNHIVVWRAPTADATTPSCLAIEHADGTNQFIVPSGDPDCDGFIANECDPDWYDYASAPTIQPPTKCLTDDPPQSACVVGTDDGRCIDGSTTSCTSEGRFCLPEKACAVAACSQFDGAACLASLIEPSTLGTVGNVAALRCTATYNTMNNNAICAGTTAPVSTATGSACTGQFASFTNTYPGFVASPSIAFSTPTFEGTLRVPVITTSSQCTVTIGNNLTNMTDQVPTAALGHGAFELVVGTHTLFMPVIVQFIPGQCTPTSFTCAFDDLDGATPDSIVNCAR